MPQGPAVGYVYGIKNPDNPAQFIFVGNGMQPWVSIKRHLYRSSNAKMRVWATEFLKKNPQVDVLTHVICDQWHEGKDTVIISPPPQGSIRLEWEVLGYEQETFPARPEDVSETLVGPVKSRIIKELLEAGHPLLNSLPGRRKKVK